MRIAAVSVIEYRRAFARPASNPATRWTERRAVLVRIETADGIVGLGEGWAPANDVEKLLDALARVVAPRLVGADIRAAAAAGLAALEPHRGEIPGWAACAASSAIGLAELDIRARAAGQPLWMHLGGTPRARVYASGGLYADGKDERALAEELRGHVDRGFTAVKMKVGGSTLDEDFARIAAVRAAIGDGELIVDALSRFDAASAPAAVRRYAAAGANAVQAPLPPDDVDAVGALLRDSPLPIWLGEAVCDVALLGRLSRLEPAPWIQLNPALVGGHRTLDLANAPDAGTRVTLQCHGTAVLQAACLQLAAGGPAIAHAEFHMFHDHLHDRLPASMRRVENGVVTLGPEPGLGLALPENDGRLRLVRRCAA